ncbi:hypothetical protein JL722_5373 [Aureococcus anophagefferens]|nr:hypothetical protein JL722_5373 [Aureococcus anophagefferens]
MASLESIFAALETEYRHDASPGERRRARGARGALARPSAACSRTAAAAALSSASALAEVAEDCIDADYNGRLPAKRRADVLKALNASAPAVVAAVFGVADRAARARGPAGERRVAALRCLRHFATRRWRPAALWAALCAALATASRSSARFKALGALGGDVAADGRRDAVDGALAPTTRAARPPRRAAGPELLLPAFREAAKLAQARKLVAALAELDAAARARRGRRLALLAAAALRRGAAGPDAPGWALLGYGFVVERVVDECGRYGDGAARDAVSVPHRGLFGSLGLLGDGASAAVLESMEHRHVTSLLKHVLEPLMLRCPPALYDSHLAPVLRRLTAHVEARLAAAWSDDGSAFGAFCRAGGLAMADFDDGAAAAMAEAATRDLGRQFVDALHVGLALRGELAQPVARALERADRAPRRRGRPSPTARRHGARRAPRGRSRPASCRRAAAATTASRPCSARSRAASGRGPTCRRAAPLGNQIFNPTSMCRGAVKVAEAAACRVHGDASYWPALALLFDEALGALVGEPAWLANAGCESTSCRSVARSTSRSCSPRTRRGSAGRRPRRRATTGRAALLALPGVGAAPVARLEDDLRAVAAHKDQKNAFHELVVLALNAKPRADDGGGAPGPAPPPPAGRRVDVSLSGAAPAMVSFPNLLAFALVAVANSRKISPKELQRREQRKREREGLRGPAAEQALQDTARTQASPALRLETQRAELEERLAELETRGAALAAEAARRALAGVLGPRPRERDGRRGGASARGGAAACAAPPAGGNATVVRFGAVDESGLASPGGAGGVLAKWRCAKRMKIAVLGGSMTCGGNLAKSDEDKGQGLALAAPGEAAVEPRRA